VTNDRLDPYLVAGISSVGLMSAILSTLVIGRVTVDPGGLAALAVFTSWVVVLAGGCVWAWFGPQSFAVPLVVAVGVIVIASVGWAALAPLDTDGQRLVAIGAFLLAAPIAIWGRYRMTFAGALGLLSGAAPVVGAAIGSSGSAIGAALGALLFTAPNLGCGVLYLVGSRPRL
jgi:hypothetical protein